MNKMKYLLPVLFLLASFNNFGQVVKFEKVYGGSGYDYGNSVIQVFDKGYVVAGNTTSYGNGNNDVYLIKTDSNGYTQWQRTFGGINVDQSFSVKQTRDSGLVIAGYTNSFGHGGYDMYVIRTDRNGDTLWTKTYGGSNWDFAYSIDTTNDGGFIVAGGTYSYGKGDEDMYLVKLNALGDTLWTKTYGGLHQEEIASVHQTADSGFIFTGETKSFEDSIAGDIYIVKTNTLGDTTWTHHYGWANEDKPADIIQTIDGGYVMAGGTDSYGYGGFDCLIMRLNSIGDSLWTRNYGTLHYNFASSVVETKSRKIAFANTTEDNGAGARDFCLFLADNNGYFLNVTSEGSVAVDEVYSISKCSDNGFIMCGYTNGFNVEQTDVFLVKTDSLGFSSNVISPSNSITEINKTENGIKVFPNPVKSNSTITIEFSGLEKFRSQADIVISDITGNTVKKISSTPINKTLSVSIADLETGLYFISIQTLGDEIGHTKFVYFK